MATKYGGYMGRILQIDLTTETVKDYPFTDQERAATLGGKTLAYHILSRELTGKEVPFSEENLIIISTGPLTGTGAPGSVRFEITALSPKTGLPMSSNCGSSFGLYLKKAGYDAIILSGRCKTHQWLEICGDQIRFHDANDLWGTGTRACRQRLSNRLDDKRFCSLCIGPAGDDLLPAATVICDGRTTGRPGFGALLGWKNLKTITVTGNHTIPFFDPAKIPEEIRNWNRSILEDPLTADPAKISSRPGCPIRCKKPGKDANPVWADLGIDSIDAQNHILWLREKHGETSENISENKTGQRRNKFYHRVLQSMGLQESDEVLQSYQNLTNVISSLGLCIFTIPTCLNPESQITLDGQYFPVSDRLLQLLQSSTGIGFQTEDLITAGNYNRELQNSLFHLFSQNNRYTLQK